MVLRVLSVFLCCCFTTLGFTQADSAKSILEHVRKHYNPDYGFEADFTFEIDFPETESVVTDGHLYLKGDKFRYITKNEEYISNNLTLWVWSKGNGINEVQVSYIDEDEDIITLSDVFNVYLKGFAYKLISETKHQGRNIALIELVPISRNDTNPYFKVKTVVDTDKNQLDQLQVYYKDGTVYTFNVKNEKPSVLTEAHFQFNVAEHAEVEVIDLR